MDVQGFECFVLAGMGHVLRTARTIHFEVEEQLLGRFQEEEEEGGAAEGEGEGPGPEAASSGAARVPVPTCSGALMVRAIQRAGFAVEGADDLSRRSDVELRDVKFPVQDMVGVRRPPPPRAR
jgi:hypothetical protein